MAQIPKECMPVLSANSNAHMSLMQGVNHEPVHIGMCSMNPVHIVRAIESWWSSLLDFGGPALDAFTSTAHRDAREKNAFHARGILQELSAAHPTSVGTPSRF